MSLFFSKITPLEAINDLFKEEVELLLIQMHREMEPVRQQLLAARKERQTKYDTGSVPEFLPANPAQVEKWAVAPLPADLLERRVEITGPANSAKMVIQMLSETADGAIANMAMIDFEDSMKPTWRNVIDAVHNVIGVAKGDLTFSQGEKKYRLNPQRMAHPMIRVRGLHLNESNVLVDGQKISASIFDVVMSVTHTARLFLKSKKTPKYYVPKCEHFLEARWWNALFQKMESALDLPKGVLKTTFLIETLPAAYQMEEILYEIRERAAGLNGGRWDKIFSDIKVLRNQEDRILANRASITMTVPWMENYAKRLIKICHKHGAFAMGGMSAFTPGKDEETRKAQTFKVAEDKCREATIGHDGCWVSHPYFIRVAKDQFQNKNQLTVTLGDFPMQPDLLPRPEGPKTIQGLRTNVRVGIAYMQGWNQGLGCVAFDNLMEDLATLEISRAQTWQWLHHQTKLDDGTVVCKALINKIFDEECDRIIHEVKQEGASQSIADTYRKAADEAKKIFLQEKLEDFLTTDSEVAK